MTITPEQATTSRDLITAGMFTRLTDRIMADSSLDRPTAERIMEQALAFLAACARNPGARLARSRVPVDGRDRPASRQQGEHIHARAAAQVDRRPAFARAEQVTRSQ
jgi:hypothetical protein